MARARHVLQRVLACPLSRRWQHTVPGKSLCFGTGSLKNEFSLNL